MVVRSSVEAKYKGMAFRVCEILWLKKLLEELALILKAMNLYCDNTSAIEIAYNPNKHD